MAYCPFFWMAISNLALEFESSPPSGAAIETFLPKALKMFPDLASMAASYYYIHRSLFLLKQTVVHVFFGGYVHGTALFRSTFGYILKRYGKNFLRSCDIYRITG